ncbi:NTP transferase domain-containing protein [Clostridium perfringens]|uniref:NTP transferase domain-containing protein n=1 Tax=Clostridium perfringens TaxID=1502 RepID=UPI0028E12EC3|nr:NTP transferase domain-containing protein [Clostridium perfringens]MDT9350053.1 NTP transferase domain-containing protein [Clostridium perfringens]
MLASGTSKRMGENKLLLDFCGKPLVEWVIESVSSIGFDEVVLVYKDPRVKEIAKKYGISTIYNKKASYGQSESIKISLEKASDSNNGYMFFTGDQPLLKRNTIIKLIESFNKKGGIVIPKVNGQNKSPTIFSSDFKYELMSLEGDIGGRLVIKNNLDKVFFVNFYSDIEFFDIDTKEELEYVRRKYNE